MDMGRQGGKCGAGEGVMERSGLTCGRLHRWDFETEEEWSQYNASREAIPKYVASW
jgi:hypothetical protein